MRGPPPIPCRIRKKTRDSRLQASPQSMEEVVNSKEEKIRNRFRPKRKLSMATMGMMITLDRIKPVGTQAISSTEAPRVPLIWGNATLTMLPLMLTIRLPVNIDRAISHL